MLSNFLLTTPGAVVATTAAAGATAFFVYRWYDNKQHTVNATTPVSVNFHFSRKCNKTCGFCFHTEKTSYVLPEEKMMHGLRLLKDAGMKKINFAGGEPFLYPKLLAKLCRFCKEELELESVSIITNGTKVTKDWMTEHGKFVDVMGVSCDSFDEQTNIKIGRGTGDNVDQLFRIREWSRELGIKFKLNTVVCTYNWQEDMVDIVSKLDPYRWKVFQVLPVQGENDATEAETELDKRKRNARKLLITDEQFAEFCSKHRRVGAERFKEEDNATMATSYLIVNEYMCFLDKGSGEEKQSKSILDVGVLEALKEVRFDKEAFVKRGGVYDWTKDMVHNQEGGCGDAGEELEW